MAGVRIRRGSVLLYLELVRAVRPRWIAWFLLLPAVARAQFTFTTNNGAITITGYTGPPWVVTIPSSTNGYPVTSIWTNAFQGSSLTSVTIPNSVTSIGDFAFSFCSSLTSVTIPNSVTTIGSWTFAGCGTLAAVTIGNSVTNIGKWMFFGCTSLTSLTVPDSVTSIGVGAFYDCFQLTNVMLGTNVASIGGSAFAGCSSLTAITVDAQNGNYSSLNGIMFDKSRNTLLLCPGGTVGSITVPTTVTSIGNTAFFQCWNLSNITIPNSVTSIGGSAFYECGLTSITIPNSVTNLGDLAFFACSLTNVTIGSSVTSIGSSVFYDCSGLTSVTIPHSVTSIGYEAFWLCTSLTSVTIPNSVTSIGDYAFGGCSNLTNVTIGNGVTSIGTNAFFNCSSLTKAYFLGNAPGGTNTIFSPESGTVYYLPGTTGWASMFGGWPTALWYQPNPMILGCGYGLGATTNGFGFTISWATNIPVVVEVCTNLANPVWNPVATNTLTGGTSYFSDSKWTNYPGRFYRLRSP